MRINSEWLTIIGFTVFTSVPIARADLSIFACEPEWGSLAKELAPGASIFSATTAKQDPHQIQARPSLISKFSKANLAVCSGASLEVGWLPALQLKASNPRLKNNEPGMFFAAQQVETIGKHDHIDPTMGDVHPEGNPHLHLDPYRVLDIASQLSKRMINIDANNSEAYTANFDHFAHQWERNIQRWEHQANALQSMKVIAYHSSFNYLFKWLGIDMVGDLEPKPGLPPSSKHLASLLELTRKTNVDAIIYASYQDARGAQWLGEKANIPVIQLPFSVEEHDTLESLFDAQINSLLNVKKRS